MIFFLLLFLDILQLFYSLHYTSFPFLRDADSRKGTLCPFCVPIHKKKKKKERERGEVVLPVRVVGAFLDKSFLVSSLQVNFCFP